MIPHLFTTAWPALVLFWAATAVCAVAQALIIRSIFGAQQRRVSEIAWAIVPAVALAAVLVMTWRKMHATV
jgi:hypothetical protein